MGPLVVEQTRAERIHELHNTLTWLEGELYKISGATRWKGYDLCLLQERHVCIVAELNAIHRAMDEMTEMMRHRSI